MSRAHVAMLHTATQAIGQQLLAINQVAAELGTDLPQPELPVQPTDLQARLEAEGTGLLVELVFTAPANSGRLPTTFEVWRDDDVTDGVERWQLVGTAPAGASLWEERLPIQKDVPYAYKVRGVKVGLDGVTRYSEFSNVADPEEFKVEVPPPDTGDRTTVEPGYNFTGKKGKFLAKPGHYPVFDPEHDVDILCKDGEMVFEVTGGKIFAHRGAKNVRLAGFKIDGKKTGGKKGPDNKNGMFQPGTGWHLTDGLVIDGAGVNIAWDGSDGRMRRVKSLRGGAAGIGGKHDRSIFWDCETEGCNYEGHRDGAGEGKSTRTNAALYIRCIIRNGKNASRWGDINNSNWVMILCVTDRMTLADPKRLWTAAGDKIEISTDKSNGMDDKIALCREAGVLSDTYGKAVVTEAELREFNFIYKSCQGLHCYSYPWDVNETKDTLIDWCSGHLAPAKDEGGHVGARNYERDDAGDERDNWRLHNLVISNFTILDDGDTFVFQGGGAGPRVDIKKNAVKIVNPMKRDGTPAKIRYERCTGHD